MHYALSSSLGSMSGLNTDKLALDLQFATDKTLTARRGPTPTFTRASTATFVGSDGLIQSAAINAPRFDHDPITLACKGLLIEEQRTNLLVRSQEFNLTWGINNSMTVTPDAVIAPDGTMTADAINFDSNVTSRIIQFAGSAAIHTFSVWLRANSATTCILDGQAVGSVSSPVVVNVTTNWQRFTYLASNFLSGTGGWNIRIQNNSTGTSGTIYAWGAQLEVGSFPTSYIPTVASTVIRSADVCSITGAGFTGIYNATEGTLWANASTPASGDRTVIAVDDNTANEMTRLRTEGTNPFFKVTDGGSEVVAIDAGTVTANTSFKLAGAYKLNDFASSINGGAAVTDTSGTLPTVDRMRIGAGQGGNTMCGHIAAIRYYKKRLSNSRLQSLTT